ncbi:MAG: DUF72 domain-containing protein [Candidatus Omnitrophota bacterium]|nr:DUF72 domain-containing protein [Candidatus Omnitrophota bacterium]
MIKKARCLIGTSGFYYNHWYDKFYPRELKKQELLPFFAKYFNTVELNNTFYHLPKEKVVENWHHNTPREFIFALKASRFITHIKRLKNLEDSLKVFLSRAYILKEKLGPVLYQLPPSMKKDSPRLEAFLKKLPSDIKNVIEFRNPSWLDKEIFDILKKHNIAHCIISMPDFPVRKEITADFVYIRMHGGEVLYGSNYSTKELRSWADDIKKFLKKGLDVYVYFNNDANAYAIKNATTLRKLM